MKKKCIMALIIGAAFLAQGCGYEEGTDAVVTVVDSTHLDGDYAAFGHVTSGMDIVDQICKDAKPTDGNGTIAKDQQPVIESIRMVD